MFYPLLNLHLLSNLWVLHTAAARLMMLAVTESIQRLLVIADQADRVLRFEEH